MPHDTVADMPHDTMGHMPHDTVLDMVHGSGIPKVNPDGSDVGSLKYNELMEICTKLSDRVNGLEKKLND